MPNEQEDTAVLDELNEEIVETEENDIETESGAVDEPAAEDPNNTKWSELLPELANSREELSTEAREGILLERLAALTRGKQATSDDETNGESLPTDQRLVSDAPPVTEIPDVDYERMTDALTDDLGEASANVITKFMKVLDGRIGGLAGLVVKSLDEYGGELTSYTRPQKLRAMLPGVPDATEPDIKAAVKLLSAGKVRSEEDALKLAVYNRQAEIGKAVRKPSESARRKAGALAASRQSGDTRRSGRTTAQRIPESGNDMRALYAADARRKAGNRK